MRIKPILLLAAGTLACVLLQFSVAHAIISVVGNSTSTPNNTSDPQPPLSGIPGWNNVGTVNGASGIYVGNGWVLTADHVGAGNFTLEVTTPNGTASGSTSTTTYNWNGIAPIRLTNTDGSGVADLVMFQVTSIPTGVSNLNVASTSPLAGTAFYNIGYGLEQNTAEEYFNYNSSTQTFTQTTNPSAAYQGFGYGSPNTKSWGQNSIVGFQSYNIGFGNVNAFYSTFTTSTDQIVSGDSGGGVFNAAGELIGVNDAIGEYPNQPADTAFINDQSDLINIAPFYSQITQISGIPEPSALALLTAAGAGILLLGRRRAARTHSI